MADSKVARKPSHLSENTLFQAFTEVNNPTFNRLSVCEKRASFFHKKT